MGDHHAPWAPRSSPRCTGGRPACRRAPPGRASARGVVGGGRRRWRASAAPPAPECRASRSDRGQRARDVVSASVAPAVGDDGAQARRPCRLRPRRIGRHRDHAGVEAAEEGGDEVEPRRVEQQRALAPAPSAWRRGGDGPRAAVELAVGEMPLLLLAVQQEGVGAHRSASSSARKRRSSTSDDAGYGLITERKSAKYVMKYGGRSPERGQSARRFRAETPGTGRRPRRSRQRLRAGSPRSSRKTPNRLLKNRDCSADCG